MPEASRVSEETVEPRRNDQSAALLRADCSAFLEGASAPGSRPRPLFQQTLARIEERVATVAKKHGENRIEWKPVETQKHPEPSRQ
jgi:hypothetical protein